jgi:hypothetical protein
MAISSGILIVALMRLFSLEAEDAAMTPRKQSGAAVSQSAVRSVIHAAAFSRG